MYGRYTKDLGEYAKDEARRLKQLERQRKKDDRARDKVNGQTDRKVCWQQSWWTSNIKQQWWEFSGTAWQAKKGQNIQGRFLVLAPFVREDGGRLGLLSTPRLHHGGFKLHDGQRNLNVHKRTRLALSRSNKRPDHSVLRLGHTSRVFDPVLSWLRSFSGAAKYRWVRWITHVIKIIIWCSFRIWNTRDEDDSERRCAERIFDL